MAIHSILSHVGDANQARRKKFFKTFFKAFPCSQLLLILNLQLIHSVTDSLSVHDSHVLTDSPINCSRARLKETPPFLGE